MMKLLPVLFLLLGLILFGFSNTIKPKPYVYPELPGFPEMPINSKNLLTEEGVKLGRYLFYDPILSKDSTVSCATCHQQKYAFTDGPVRFSKGIQDIPLKRNTPPLFNLAWNEALFWDGKAKSIEEQVFFPVRDHLEMNLDWSTAVKRVSRSPFYDVLFLEAFGSSTIDSVLIAKAIAQFERSIISHNSKLDQALRREIYLTPEEFKGYELINDQSKGNCLHCHTTDVNFLGTTGRFSNNGLEPVNDINNYTDKGRGGVTGNEKEMGLFRIPSLRNVAVTAPYMHDGRFNTLEEVLDFYTNGVQKSVNIDPKMHFGHDHGIHLTEEEKRLIITFMATLTDSVLLTSEAYSNPFTK